MEDLLEFCETDRQREIISMVIACGGNKTKAARELGIDLRNVQKCCQKVSGLAAKRGWSPNHDMSQSVPSGYVAKGVSTLYDDEGNVKIQWVKSALTQEDKLEAMTNALENIADITAGLAPKVAKPRKRLAKDELATYLIGDAHMGMYADANISGHDFDCEIASRDLKYAFDRLVQNAPDSETCLLLNLGDFFHFDNYEGVTARANNALDCDTRLERVFGIGVSVMNYMVMRALEKHKTVVCRNVRGNHDDLLSMALKHQMEAFWKDEKRVKIEMSPAPCWTYEFGKVGLLVTHGHSPKPNKLPEVFAGVHSKLWGRTEYRYVLHGHFHSKMTHDSAGVRVEGFCNLAPNDAWHNEQGYCSPQEMTMVVYHKDRGEIRRSIERPA